MGKGGKGKGKGKGKKGKVAAVVDPNLLTEVDKTFYELQIADINRKLTRYRSLSQELEVANERLTAELKKVDEDRNDVVIYLKRSLTERSDEITDLQVRLKASEELRSEDTHALKAEIVQKNEEFRLMHEQLTSDVKLLSGKLNSLEEFRTQREELMKKFDKQQVEIEEQDARHKKELYEIEKKFILAKDKLKRDMEARLVQLSTEFQGVTETRIASTTHRVIRENIAINNELDAMITDQKRLHRENEKLTSLNRTYKLDAKLYQDEKTMITAKYNVQFKIVEDLTKEIEGLKSKVAKYKSLEDDIFKCKKELKLMTDTNNQLCVKVRILEQNLHVIRCSRAGLKTEYEYCKEELDRYSTLTYEAVIAIKHALVAKTEGKDEAKIAASREALLSNILALMSKARTEKARRPSLESIDSATAGYAVGDLGFIPKPIVSRTKFSTKRSIQTEIGSSFENMLKVHEKEMKQQEESEIIAFTEDSDHLIREKRKSALLSKRYTFKKDSDKTQLSEAFDRSSNTTSDPKMHYYMDFLPPKQVSIKSLVSGASDEATSEDTLDSMESKKVEEVSEEEEKAEEPSENFEIDV